MQIANLNFRMAWVILCLIFIKNVNSQQFRPESLSDYQQKIIRNSLEVQTLLHSEKEVSDPSHGVFNQARFSESGSSQGESYKTNITDSLALVALFNSTNGAGWTNNTNWLTGPVNTWYGIYAFGGRVLEIHLYDNNLVGSIPAEIGDLTELKVLFLFNNHLSGSIPQSIGNLIQLDDLNLSGNQLNGTIPTAIGNLTLLKYLNLGTNNLSGNVPAEIGNLVNLTYLLLGVNSFTGSIPSTLGNLTQLEVLGLYSNFLSGSIPAEVGNLSHLRILYLGGNNLTGCIPAEIGNLVNLEHLYLYNNDLNGELPHTLGNLINLNTLFLSNNAFSGSIPVEIGMLYNLNSLCLDGNQFSGSIPQSIYNLYNLVGLQLNNNSLTGAIHSDIGNLSKLQTLILSNNQFEGNIPQEISNLSNLVVLNIANCKFDDLPDLNALTSLTTLVIINNKLTFEDIENNFGIAQIFDYSPQDSVGLKTNLQFIAGDNVEFSVNVGGSQNIYQWYKDGDVISGADNPYIYIYNAKKTDAGSYTCKISNAVATNLILDSRPININIQYGASYADSVILVTLYNNTNGIHWNEKANWLTGPLNTWEGIKLENGRVVMISLVNNNLSGPIPNEIADLSYLKHLELSTNFLTGSIPSSVGRLTRLEAWMTSGNHLSGNIPREISNMTNLQIFYCGDNQLTGSIPPEIGNLTNLEQIGINNNHLSGSIPAELGNLSKLKQLSLWNNELSGSIPQELGNLNNLSVLFLTNNQLSGNIPASLGNMDNLTGLQLGNNKLNGAIPESLSNLSQLQSIDLSYNQLTGSVPSGFANLPSLISLWVQSNYLENLPEFNQLDFLYVERNKFTFEDIEPNIGKTRYIFTYAPQDSVGIKKVVKVSAGENITLTTGANASHNVYHWYKDNQIISGAQSSTLPIINANTDDEGVYICRIDNTLATALTLVTRPVTVKLLPPQPGPVSGHFTVCSGSYETYSIDLVDGATSYTWTLPSGWTGSSTTCSISVTASGNSGYITVAANNSNGTGTSRSYYITVRSKPSQPASISGEMEVCAGTSNTYSIQEVSEATSYNWSLPSGWSGTSTTTSITGLAGYSGTVYVSAENNCGTSNSSTLSVVVSGFPSSPAVDDITQPDCEDSYGSVLLNNLPQSGTWTIKGTPADLTFVGNTPSFSISLNPGTYTFTVTNSSGCESSPTGNVVINNKPGVPSAPLFDTIIQTSCGVDHGSVILEGLPETGTWTLTTNPGSAETQGSGTTVMITDLDPGTYSFKVTNDDECASEFSSDAIINQAPEVPGVPVIDSIVHPTCEISEGTIYLSHLPSEGDWTLTINSGSTKYSGTGAAHSLPGMLSGIYNFTVTNASGCTSMISDESEVNAQPETPVTPVITQEGEILYSDAASGNQWYNENGPVENAISKEFVPDVNGNYFVIVSNGTCISDSSNIIGYILSRIEQSELEQSLDLYPNPVSNELMIEVKNQADNLNYEILNGSGSLIMNGTFIGRTVIKTTDMVSGFYMIRIRSKNSCIIKKIIKE